MDVHGSSPHDVFGNYAGYADMLGTSGTEGNDDGGLIDMSIDLLGDIFGA